MFLKQPFYNRPTLKVAQDLLGCFLAKRFTDVRYPIGCRTSKTIRFKIVETEAYNGPNDLASHASRGRTERNKIMFGKPGTIYIYFTYGLHYMLNIVTEREGYPAAILIRAIEYSGNEQIHLKTNGPAKLTKTLNIDKTFNGRPIYTKKYGLWIESRQKLIKIPQIVKTTRVGVDYAGKYKNKKWRFYIKDNRFVSKK